MKTCESALYNSFFVQTGLKTDVDKVLIWRQPLTHCQVTALIKRKPLLFLAVTKDSINTAACTAPLSYRIYLLLLATSLSKVSCNSERSASVTISNLPAASSSLCSCRGVAECGDPLVSLIQLQIPRVATLFIVTGGNVLKLLLMCNLAPVLCKAHTIKLQVLAHCLKIQAFCSQVSTVVISTFLMSHLITRRCSHSVVVAMCLMRPAPLRIAMARPSVASNLISRLGLSIPSPCLFAFTSTPWCCKTTPRSRNIKTQPIPEAAALTVPLSLASSLALYLALIS